MELISKTKGRLNMPLLLFFLTGFTLGMIGMYLGRGFFLQGRGYFDQHTLYQMKYMEVESGPFFWYVCKERLGTIFVLLLLGTTYLGIRILHLYAGWMGFSLGMMAAASVIRYGLKGILLMIVSVFPHYLFYVPGWFLLCFLVRQLYTVFFIEAPKTGNGTLFFLSFGKVAGVVIIGVWLESYVNPNLVIALLKVF